MPSSHFQGLDGAVKELQSIYLAGLAGNASPTPTPEQQELARAFVVMVHSEIEFFLEALCIELATLAANEAVAGRYSVVSLSMLEFSQLAPIGAGDLLNAPSRKLATRLFDALSKYKKLISDNNGINEKYLTKMLVPLGITSAAIDSIWLAELDKLCSDRGIFAHSSRRDAATHLSVNPTDVLTRCQRLVWKSPGAEPGTIGSFEELDEWVAARTTEFAIAFCLPLPRWLRLLRWLRRLF